MNMDVGEHYEKVWTVVLETPTGLEQVILVRYPRRPTDDLAAGLVRLHLKMPTAIPESFRDHDEPALRALEECGYKLIWVGEPTEIIGRQRPLRDP